jgi:predicted NUDIX family NTP pyrophosphohydrolase
VAARSAGLLLFRHGGDRPEVLLAHMGGPFWARKDAGAWSIPKGEYDETEEPLDAARREFAEEIGSPPPGGDYLELGEVKQTNGKVVVAWAIEGDLDVARVVSNTFEMEWPKGSGQRQHFAEIDRAEWFDLPTAAAKIVKAQAAFLDRLSGLLTG